MTLSEYLSPDKDGVDGDIRRGRRPGSSSCSCSSTLGFDAQYAYVQRNHLKAIAGSQRIDTWCWI
ncbi:hypothetical protein KQH23_31885, partial [Streptomyces sp. CHB19.2]|nr:hypothetical protein [Streptomyces sp. CHB19.2]